MVYVNVALPAEAGGVYNPVEFTPAPDHEPPEGEPVS